MKKIVEAGVGGRSFSFEEDACNRLQAYIDEFRRRVDMGNMTSEVMDDVESRIGELLSAKVYTSKEVITLPMVEDIISQLGMPDQNGDEAREETKEEKNMNSTANKKFYRDSDNKFIGGVCSGLAIYFNIDTMLIRIIFLVLLIAGTAGFWAYLILWFVAPLAKTSAQKCELRGLPVTAENMAKYPSSK